MNINVVGTPEQQQLVADALARATVDIDSLLTRPVTITFGTPDNVPGTDKPAWGYTKGRRITLNAKMAATKPARIQYTAIHELGHALDADLNNAVKRQLLMTLMAPPTTRWNSGPYKSRGAEGFADAFAEAVGFASPLDAYYPDVTDLDRLLTILQTPATPEDPGDPPPAIDPKDIVIAGLQDALNEANRKIAAAKEALA